MTKSNLQRHLSAAFVALSLFCGTASTVFAQTCPSGYPNSCGNGRCCPSGYTCGGSCGAECCGPPGSGSSSSSGGSSSGGGGGLCPAGYPNDCGNNRCCPSGTTCGGSCGGECCATNNTGGGSYSNTSSSSSGGPQTGGDTAVCQTTYAGSGCTKVQACAAPGRAWYNADGEIFECSGTSCQSAAERLADYCSGSGGGGGSSSGSSDHHTGGCSTTPGESPNGLLGLALGGLVFAGISAARKRRASAAAQNGGAK